MGFLHYGYLSNRFRPVGAKVLHSTGDYFSMLMWSATIIWSNVPSLFVIVTWELLEREWMVRLVIHFPTVTLEGCRHSLWLEGSYNESEWWGWPSLSRLEGWDVIVLYIYKLPNNKRLHTGGGEGRQKARETPAEAHRHNYPECKPKPYLSANWSSC